MSLKTGRLVVNIPLNYLPKLDQIKKRLEEEGKDSSMENILGALVCTALDEILEGEEDGERPSEPEPGGTVSASGTEEDSTGPRDQE